MKNSLLISTGGSGGHVIPATILYEHLAQQNSVIISIDKRGLKYLDKNNYQFEIIDTPKLSNFLLLPINLIIILFLTCKSLYFLKKKKSKYNFFYWWIHVTTINFSCKSIKVEIIPFRTKSCFRSCK